MKSNLAKVQPPAPEESQTRTILETEYQVDVEDITRSESLTFVILELTVNQMYERAIREVRAYANYKSDYPTYKERTDRLFDHIVNLINAIKTKKSLTMVTSLPASKRREINKVISLHFQDLKRSLQRVTQIEYHLRLQDSRSTIWVINTFFFCLFIIILFAVLREAFESMRAPAEVIQKDLLSWIYKKLDM